MRTMLYGLAALLAGLLALPAVAAPFAYVPNCGSNDVSVIDTATNLEVPPRIFLPGASCPVSVAANAAGTRVYIGNNNGTVSVIDTSSTPNPGAAPAAVALPVSCFHGLAVNPAGTRGYAIGCNSHNVVVLDLTTSPVTMLANVSGVGLNGPRGAVVSPDGSRVYVANRGALNVAVIDTTNSNAVSFIPLSNRYPYGIVLDASGNNLWVSHDNLVGSVGGVTRISNPAGAWTVATAIGTGSCTRGIAINATGSTVYVSNYCDFTVSAINTTSLAVTSAGTGNNPWGVSVTPDGSRVLVTNLNSASVSVFNASLALQATVAVGSNPYSHGIFIAQPAAPATADITGTVTTSLSVPMSGVTVINGALTTTTNGSGVYSFANLANGSYTITPPSLPNYSFAPSSHNVTLSGTDVTGRNFVGTYDGRPDITTLRAMVVAANLTDTRLRSSLLAPLDAALVWLNGTSPDRVQYSCSNLAKFIAVVRQNITYGKLPAATGNPWIVAANDILALSGCPTR